MELNDKKNILSIGLRVWYKKYHPPKLNTLYFRFTIFLGILTIIYSIMGGYYNFWKSDKISCITINGAFLLMTLWIACIAGTHKKRIKLFRKNTLNHYLPCPFCNKSVKVFYDWKCDWCGNYQGEDRYLCEPCKIDGRYLEKANCEHCNREFKI